MTKDSQDELVRAYAWIKALRGTVSQISSMSIKETYVHEFHGALEKLKEAGIDVSEFCIPDSELNPVSTSIPVFDAGVRSKGGGTYSKEKYVGKIFLLTRIDTILGYFEIITSDKPRKIGFKNKN